MHALLRAFVASSVAYVAIANPIPAESSAETANASGRKAVVLNQSASRQGKTGPQALASAYRKYRKPLPKAVANAAAADDEARNGSAGTVNINAAGNVTATPELYDAEYLCPVYIGSNNQLLNLNFDTGSSDLWVFSSLQPAAQSSGHSIYTPGSSTSARQISGATFNVQYGDGSGATGTVYQDSVNIAGITVTSQAVEAAQSVSAQFQSDINADGIVGLAFSNLNTVRPTQQKTYFDTAIAQGRLNSNLFTANLKKAKPGSYGFGAIDTTQYTGAITYTTVDKSRGYWGFTSSGYQIGTSAFTSTNIAGIADTGTTLLLLPNNVVTAYYGRVTGAAYDNNYGAWTFPCSATLPTFTVGVGTGRYTLPGPYMNYGPVSQTTCYGGLQSSDGFGINIFGDIFLKGVFVVFDNNGPRLGFANKNLS